jgi:cytochrome b
VNLGASRGHIATVAKASMTTITEATVSSRVWDPAVRLVHWAMVLLLIALVATALIGGDAMPWHVRAGEAMLALVVFRIVWGFVGTRYARFSSFVRGPRAVFAYARSILRPPHAFHIGHNPLGGWMVVILLLALLVQTTTGLFSNDEVLTEGPLVKIITGDLSDAISSIHSKNAWVVVALASLHICAVVFYLVRLKENLIKPMLVGDKAIPALAPDARPPAESSRNRLAAVLFAIVAGGVWFIATHRW